MLILASPSRSLQCCIGMSVRKEFEGHGIFNGIVRSARQDESLPESDEVPGEVLYRIEYQDGDEEEVTAAELRLILVPPAPPAPLTKSPFPALGAAASVPCGSTDQPSAVVDYPGSSGSERYALDALVAAFAGRESAAQQASRDASAKAAATRRRDTERAELVTRYAPHNYHVPVCPSCLTLPCACCAAAAIRRGRFCSTLTTASTSCGASRGPSGLRAPPRSARPRGPRRSPAPTGKLVRPPRMPLEPPRRMRTAQRLWPSARSSSEGRVRDGGPWQRPWWRAAMEEIARESSSSARMSGKAPL